MAGRSETAEKLCEQARRAKEHGDTHSAEQLLASAVERSPGDTETRLELAEMLLAHGNAGGASEHLKILAEQSPDDPRCFVGLGEAMYLEHKLTEAAMLAERALELDPRHPRGLLLRGKIEQAQGDDGRALQDFYRVLDGVPEHPEAKLLAAELQLKQGDARLAAPLVRSIIDDSDLNNPYRERAYWLLGECYASDGRWADAARALASGVPSRPGLAADWNKLADACWRSGDRRGAGQAVHQALAADPTDKQALALRAALAQHPHGGQPTSVVTRMSHLESRAGSAPGAERPQIQPGQ